jgi:arabinose-5-phosphate isomerase
LHHFTSSATAFIAAMSSQAVTPLFPQSAFELLQLGRDVLQAEAAALAALIKRFPPQFAEAVRMLEACQGNVIVTGMGKAGLIGQKIAATLASTGTPSHFVHPAEAIHGDLGRIQSRDVVLALSYSGETEEIVRLLPELAKRGAPLIAITASQQSALGQAAHLVLPLGRLREACPLGLAPTASTTAMLALGDALALVASRLKGFGREDFARHHPGGNLGRRLSKVEHHMRPLSECRVTEDSLSVREVLIRVSRPGRRSGAVLLVDAAGRLTGIFTDSDLSRLLEQRRDEVLDGPICAVMSQHPTTVALGSPLSAAVTVMAERKISELPVLDSQGKPLGLIDVTDLVALVPAEEGA